jgi:hypothetical protein
VRDRRLKMKLGPKGWTVTDKKEVVGIGRTMEIALNRAVARMTARPAPEVSR